MMLANSSVTAAVRVPSTSRVRSAGVVPRRSLRVRAEEKSFADQVDEAAQVSQTLLCSLQAQGLPCARSLQCAAAEICSLH